MNLLPYDGELVYLGPVFSLEEQSHYLKSLKSEVNWSQERIRMYGKEIVMRRKVAWYANQNSIYKYGGYERQAFLWTNILLELKQKVETWSNSNFNSCLLNYYLDGEDGMGWHSDNEKELKKHACISSVSFGAGRKMKFKHKTTKEVVDLYLEPGSLVLMKNEIQDFWLHSIPKTKKVNSERINLTFRTYDTNNNRNPT
ncbi:MAG: alpha-ketoglutarate-dependent dioxygenase AlkB family protein [Flavobacteriaceae bacterium]